MFGKNDFSYPNRKGSLLNLGRQPAVLIRKIQNSDALNKSLTLSYNNERASYTNLEAKRKTQDDKDKNHPCRNHAIADRTYGTFCHQQGTIDAWEYHGSEDPL